MEAENPRSPKVVDMGIYDQLLTSLVQNDQNQQNWTKIHEVLLHRHFRVFGIKEIIIAYEVKLRQSRSNFAGFGHFELRRSRADHRYP